MIPKMKISKEDRDKLQSRMSLLELLSKLGVKSADTQPWWLANNPAGRVEMVVSMLQSGLLSPQKAKELLNI